MILRYRAQIVCRIVARVFIACLQREKCVTFKAREGRHTGEPFRLLWIRFTSGKTCTGFNSHTHTHTQKKSILIVVLPLPLYSEWDDHRRRNLLSFIRKNNTRKHAHTCFEKMGICMGYWYRKHANTCFEEMGVCMGYWNCWPSFEVTEVYAI